MTTPNLNNLILQTAFCCMASDGNIDKREVATIKSMCEKSPLFENIDIQAELNLLVEKINVEGKKFITDYFGLLKNISLSEEAELTLLDFAIQTILADEKIEYSEIKFFKNIRYRLKVSDEKILERFAEVPDIEMFLGQDIVTNSFLDKISSLFLDTVELPQFEIINIDTEK
jgi:uncharacterized tellurite resistance protein B-like protein